MSLTQNRWFRRFGLAAIAAVALGTAAMTTAPAQAHEYGYRGPVIAYHASYFPRLFFGHTWDHRDHWDHRDYAEHHWR